MVSDERALAVRWLATERRRPRPDVRRPRRRRFGRRGTTSSTPPPGCWIAASVDRALARLPPRRRSSALLADARRRRTVAASELASSAACWRSLGDDGAPFGAVAGTRAGGIHRRVPMPSSPSRPRRPSSTADDSDAAARRRARVHAPSARSPTCCSPACTRRSRAPARARSARPTASRLTDAGAARVGGRARRPGRRGRRSRPRHAPLDREWVVTDARRRAGSKRRPRRALGDDRRGAPRRRCRRVCAPHDGGFRPLSSWAGAYPLRRRVDRRARRACDASPSAGA